MFYLKNDKVYLTEKDSETNKYPEVELVVIGVDTYTASTVNYSVQKKGAGESSKPSGRQVIGMEELIAKFGDEALAHYLLPDCEVTFNVQSHGTAPAKQELKEGDKVTKPADPTAEDYIFIGWYKEAGCINAWDFDTDTVEEDTTLYAKWVSDADSLTYNANGGTGSMDPTTGKTGRNVTVAENTFTYEGHTFSTWNTAADGSGTDYAPGANFKLTLGTDVLYAQWAENAPASEPEQQGEG